MHRRLAQRSPCCVEVQQSFRLMERPDHRLLNGQTLGVGDQVATLTGGLALVTFFDGSEVELGAETTVIIREMDQRGGTTTHHAGKRGRHHPQPGRDTLRRRTPEP